jgi:hypothetical protein
MAGTWDFVGVLFAVSGFLLYAGPCLLTGWHYGSRELWLHLRFQSLRDPSDQAWLWWLFFLAGYFATVLGSAALLLWYRRRVTSIYNVVPEVLDESLARTLDRLGLPWNRRRNLIYIGAPSPGTSRSGAANEAAAADPGWEVDLLQDSTAARAIVEVNPFPAMHHASLRWTDDGGLVRPVVEAELGRVLATVPTGDNSVGVWLLAIGTFLLAAIFFVLLFFAYVLVRQLWRTF